MILLSRTDLSLARRNTLANPPAVWMAHACL